LEDYICQLDSKQTCETSGMTETVPFY